MYSSLFDCGEQQDFSGDDTDWHNLDWDLDPAEREALLDEYNEEMALRLLLDEQDARDEYRRDDLAGWATPEDEIPF